MNLYTDSMKRSSDSSRRFSTWNLRHFRPTRSNWSSGDPSHDSSNQETDKVAVSRRDGLSGVEDEAAIDPYARVFEIGDVSLREWLDKPERFVDSLECLTIFRQIAEIVNLAHSRGIVHNARPSRFAISSYNRVSFAESASCSESGSHTFNGSSSLVEDTEHNSAVGGGNVLLMETVWYTSPEEGAGASSSCASDIYQLGVLLFELYCPCSSREEKSRTMSSLRHRLLPPQLLLKWPKEAAFCLWLLHPEPSSRPKTGELLQSEFLNELVNDLEEQRAAIELKERIDEQELLLEFLLLMQQRKREMADKLENTVSFLCSDIEEVTKQQTIQTKYADTDLNDSQNLEALPRNTSRLMKNFKKLELAYFLTRSNVSNLDSKERYFEGRDSRWINPFLEGLCKYLSFSKLKVKAELNQNDLLNSSNLVCTLSFDRDGQFFASAGVNKKIKVFEYNAIISKDHDIHYPVVEMTSRSKLSSICWNSYIKSQIASSNFDGLVQIWDVSRSQVLTEMSEHERRVWSIDFSSADPTMLASGSDDGSVKLWSINQGVSIGTIKTKANVCCVQFPSDSERFLAFGSADHNVYYYDLRNAKIPLCTLVGHEKTVSYVKFVDATNLVSASTDNTLKLWDLSACTTQVIDTPAQSFTGHTNMKNFVGLSISDGYIATGSETNEVFVYHKAFPMPALSFQFSSSDPGDEVDDTARFISSVCWHGQSSTLVAANSSGNIKILEMV